MTLTLRCSTACMAALVVLVSARVDGQRPDAPLPGTVTPAIRVGDRVGETPTAYDDGNRRDPFVSLIAPKAPPTSANATATRVRPVAGLAGVSVSDVAVKGLIRSGATLIALLQTPDGRTFMAKRLDRLQDGVVTRIDSDAVIFTEHTTDAAGAVRSRDVRKPLRPAVSGGRP